MLLMQEVKSTNFGSNACKARTNADREWLVSEASLAHRRPLSSPLFYPRPPVLQPAIQHTNILCIYIFSLESSF